MDDHVHRYAATCVWAGSTAAGYDTYDRAHTGTAPPAAATLALSSDPVFRGDARLLNPEALLVLSASSCQLLSFLAVAAAFHLPVLFLADNPGVLAGSASERAGILRHAARMFAAQTRITSPKLHVTLRKAYGFGSSLMAMNPFDDQTVTLALPGARLGAMPAEGGADAARVDGDTKAVLEHAELGGAYSAADTMSYDEVVAPAELRDALLHALRLTATRRQLPVRPVGQPGVLP